jgi:hypothetical protein
MMSYVCFRKDEDTFIMLNYAPVTDSSFIKVDQYISESSSIAFYNLYAEGQSDDTTMIAGKWTKSTGSPPMFTGSGEKGAAKVIIDDAQVLFTNEFTNLTKSTTQYTLQVRRSTLRFVETLEVVPPATAKDKSHKQFTRSGHCAAFKE